MTPEMPQGKNLVLIIVAFCVMLASSLGFAAILSTDDHSKITEYLLLLMSVVFTPIFGVLIWMLKQNQEVVTTNKSKIEDTHKKVNELANGELEAKIRRIVREVFIEFHGEQPKQQEE